MHHPVGLDGLVDVVEKGGVFWVGEVLHPEELLTLGDAVGGEGGGTGFFVHDVVAADVVVLLLGVQLLHLHHGQPLGTGVRLGIQVGGLVPRAGDDEGGTGFVDEDRVHLVHNGVVVAPLHLVLLVGHHVVPQIIEAEFIVGAVGDVGVVGLPPLGRVQAVDDEAHLQPQEPVHLAHPFAVPLGQVVVDGDDVDPFAGQGI